MLGAVGEETTIALEGLTADGNFDLQSLLHVAHPLAIHVCGADVELVIQNEPDRNLVGLARLTTVLGQRLGLFSWYPLQIA